jgi:hypothetical protein
MQRFTTAVLALAIATSAGVAGVATAAAAVPARQASHGPSASSACLASSSASRPVDAPVGPTIETLSDKAGGAIRIDGTAVPHTATRGDIYAAVINRWNRRVEESAEVARSGDGISQLVALAKKWDSTGCLMVVSGRDGLPYDKSAIDAMDDLVKLIGGSSRGLTNPQYNGLVYGGGHPFSFLGVDKGAPDSMFYNLDDVDTMAVPPATTGTTPAGDLVGYLRLNSGTNQYDYVNDDVATFNTAATGLSGAASIIQLDGRDFQAPAFRPSSPTAVTAGFHVLSVNPVTLHVIANASILTNDPGYNEQELQNEAYLSLDRLALGQPAPVDGFSHRFVLLFIQSIGHPFGKGTGWNQMADLIADLGGNKQAFFALSGTQDFSLVGEQHTMAEPAIPSAQASSLLGQAGPLAGVLMRTQDVVFAPLAAGPLTGVNTRLTQLAYQTPTAFPAISGEGRQAAESYIGRQLDLCPDSPAPARCNVRTAYYLHYSAEWGTKYTDLAVMNPPADATEAFRRDFAAVKTILEPEFSALSQVKAYFTRLGDIFDKAAVPGRIDLDTLGNQVYKEMGSPPGNSVVSDLALAGKLAALGTFAGPPASAVAAGVSAAFALAAYLVAQNGTPNLPADAVRVKSQELAKQLQDQLYQTASSLTGLGLLFAGDYGALMSAKSLILSRDWELPANLALALSSISVAAKRWFAAGLIPNAYPWLVHLLPAINVRDLTCDSHYHYWYAQGVPGLAQFQWTDSFNPDGTRHLATYFASRRVPWSDPDGNSFGMTNEIGGYLFDDPAQHPGALGIEPLALLNPDVWGVIYNARDGAGWCDLPH